MSLTPNILGFHTNEEEKVVQFVEKKELVLFNDKTYLGNGMYFWDNESNAEYWADRKLKKSNGTLTEVLICKANILLDGDVLDLTDSNVLNRIKLLWLAYCNKKGEKKKIQFIGNILDILRVFFEEIGAMKVSKCHGDYQHHDKNIFLKDLTMKFATLDNRNKTIYAVTCESKIQDQNYFKKIPAN